MFSLKSPIGFAWHRFVHISWVSFKDVFVNWNEELSLRAECDECGEGHTLSYSWDLFLVNATKRTRMEGKVTAAFILLTQARTQCSRVAEDTQAPRHLDQCPWLCPSHRAPQPLSFMLTETEMPERCGSDTCTRPRTCLHPSRLLLSLGPVPAPALRPAISDPSPGGGFLGWEGWVPVLRRAVAR